MGFAIDFLTITPVTFVPDYKDFTTASTLGRHRCFGNRVKLAQYPDCVKATGARTEKIRVGARMEAFRVRAYKTT